MKPGTPRWNATSASVCGLLVRKVGGYSLRLPRRRRVGNFRFAVAEVLPLLDHARDFCGDHRFPRRVAILDPAQHVARKNVQEALVEIVELTNPVAVDQVA